MKYKTHETTLFSSGTITLRLHLWIPSSWHEKKERKSANMRAITLKHLVNGVENIVKAFFASTWFSPYCSSYSINYQLPCRAALFCNWIISFYRNTNWTWFVLKKIGTNPWCMKITEKVAFNIAREASYIYILSGQKLIKNTKRQKCFILASFWKPEVYGQTVLPDRSILIGQKLVEKAKNSNETF